MLGASSRPPAFRHGRILIEVSIASGGLVDAEVEYAVDKDEVRRREVRSAVRFHRGGKCQYPAVGKVDKLACC